VPCASPSAPLTVSSCQVNISTTIRMKEKQVIYSELIDLSELVYLLSCCRVDFRPVGWGESSWQMVSGSFSVGRCRERRWLHKTAKLLLNLHIASICDDIAHAVRYEQIN